MADASEYEASNIRDAIQKIESALKGGTNLIDEFRLKGELSNKRAQLAESTNMQEYFEKDKKDEKSRETAAAISSLVERESKLNAQEKAEYADFLEQDYFTRADVKRLNEFYAGTWDKLSDNGKAEISHRLWEGVKRGELEFSDLSENAQKKETEFLYRRMKGEIQTDRPVPDLLLKNRDEFIREYESGNHERASKILNAAAENLSSRTESSLVEDSVAEVKKPDGEKNAVDKPKESMPEGLDALAKISPVQETDSVTVPSAIAPSAVGSQVRGG